MLKGKIIIANTEAKLGFRVVVVHRQKICPPSSENVLTCGVETHKNKLSGLGIGLVWPLLVAGQFSKVPFLAIASEVGDRLLLVRHTEHPVSWKHGNAEIFATLHRCVMYT